MKKILLYIMTTILLASCHDNLQVEDSLVEDGKVKLTFAVNIPDAPAASRSFTEPAITNLYLIVFDNNGYLVEKALATPTGAHSVTEETEFSVTLTASASKRIIHFVANYNGPDILPFGSESDIVGGMVHEKGADAYWQRIELTGGVNSTSLTGQTIPLLRNHAKITVSLNTTGDTNFTLTGFAVVNVVEQGYVSPYNRSTGDFAKFIAMSDGQTFNQDNAGKFDCRDYVSITEGDTDYEGYVPGSAGLSLNTEEPADMTTEGVNSSFTAGEWVKAGGTFYMYERGFETENHTYLIVKGKYEHGTEETYYKVDLIYQDEDGLTQYYNLLRNFQYNIIIDKVTGNGKATAAEACAMTGAHNNLAASIETQSLTNISDGTEQLFVSYTQEYIVSDAPITLLYKYIPDVSVGDVNNATDTPVKIVWEKGDVIKNLEVASTDENGWRTITITPNAPDDNNVYKQTITIVAGNLSRTVTYILRKPYQMTMECSPELVSTTIGSSVNVVTTIPANLPESLFPLTFFIEAEERSIYPDAEANHLPVEIVPGGLLDGSLYDSGRTFGYTMEMTWEEYNGTVSYNDKSETIVDNGDGTKSFTCYFKTNLEASASDVTIYNKYFSIASDEFRNPTVITLSDNELTWTLSSAGTYTSQTVTVDINNDVEVSCSESANFDITVNEGTIVVCPKSSVNSGSVTETVTISTSDGGQASLTLSVEDVVTITIPARNISVQGQRLNEIYNQTWTIYTDSGYTNAIGTCKFTKSGDSYYLLALTLNIPGGVEKLYFVYKNGNTTYYGSMSVTELKDAQTTSGKVLNINRTQN